MSEDGFTRMGYRVELGHAPGKALDKVLLFRCMTNNFITYQDDDTYRRNPGPNPLSCLQLMAPITKGQMVASIRAWLSVYQDGELMQQVEGVVDVALGALHEAPVPETPKPSQGQSN